jgi:hypothetical protein
MLLVRLETLAGRELAGHGFELNPALDEEDVAAFEHRHGITLPEDYRWFITNVGNGGMGPDYGFFPLGQTDDGDDLAAWQQGDGFVGTLSLPFPHVQPWNDLSGKPDDDLADTDERRYEKDLDAFEKKYFDAANMNGAIPLSHIGCALRRWLVITGSEAGHVWFDGRADYEGLAPVTNARGERLTFLEWYDE